MSHLIIQYCPNDVGENKAYLDNGNRLVIAPESGYLRSAATHLADTRYYFGKHTQRLGELLLRQILPASLKPPAAQIETEEEVDLFLNALNNTPIDLSNVDLIVLEINAYARNNSDFTDALERAAALKVRPGKVKSLSVLDLSRTLTPDKYYVLGDHMSAQGHRAAADALLPALQ